MPEQPIAQATTTVHVIHEFKSPPEEVFDAWLNQQTAAQFLFKTPTAEMQKVEIDARQGGSYCIIERRDGKNAEHRGKYIEIDRPMRLKFSFSGPDFPDTFVTIDITPQAAGCKLTLTHEGVWQDYAERTKEGWIKILKTLETVIQHKAERAT